MPDDPLDPGRPGSDTATVEAAGKLSEALETVEEARGHVYAFHRLTGTADLAVGEAGDLLDGAGHRESPPSWARNSSDAGCWVGAGRSRSSRDYDDGYYATCRRLEERVRRELIDGRGHVHGTEPKESRRTPGREEPGASP